MNPVKSFCCFNKISLFISLCIASWSCSSNDDDAAQPNVTVEIDAPVTIVMEEGDSRQLTATASDGRAIAWSSSNESVATVDEAGNVNALAYGKVTITAKSASGSMAKRTILVKGYTLVWSDEFDQEKLDPEVWNYEIGTGSWGWGNNEKQYYTNRPENVRLENGELVIEARKEDYNGSAYTSARITTKNNKDFTYGRIEARMKLPKGGGTWPAFWMLGYGSWPRCGEIDIMEHVGNDPNMISHALHTSAANGSNGKNWYQQKRDINVEDEWHTYGIEWIENENETYERDAIFFLIDGERTGFRRHSPQESDDDTVWPFTKPEYIIFNLAIGGNMGGAINDDAFNQPVEMHVDWVRVYQKLLPL